MTLLARADQRYQSLSISTANTNNSANANASIPIYAAQQHHLPPSPLPSFAFAPPHLSSASFLEPLTLSPDTMNYPQQRYPEHSHTRSGSSGANMPPQIMYPPYQAPQQQQPQQYYNQQQYAQQQYQPQNQQYISSPNPNPYAARRTPSTNTFASSSSGQRQSMLPPQHQDHLRRSSSARSGGSTGTQSNANSYVALMRRQKATVWCERAQHEDVRLIAAQKAAKMRAQQEILREGRTRTLGATQSGSGGGVRITAKIRHQKLAAYGQSSNPGGLGADWGVGVGGVPMRLSATEVEGGDSDDDEYQYPRPNSSRNSFASGNRQYRASGRFSRDGTPPSGGTSARNSLAELAEAGETPLASQQNSSNYFPTQPTAAPPPPPGSAGQVGRTPTTRSAGSGGSGSSGERADAVPDLDAARVASNQLMSGMASQSNTGKLQRQPSSRNLEDLKRRGSVDERTATMSMKGLGAAGTGRLFIANPDLDSD